MTDPVMPDVQKRGPGRPPMRQEAREQVHDAAHVKSRESRIPRRRKSFNEDKYFIPPDLKQDGMDYQWCRYSVNGEVDLPHIAELENQMWVPVLPEEMPGLPHMRVEGMIQRDGLMLMKRPDYESDDARLENEIQARKVAQAQVQGLANINLGQGFEVSGQHTGVQKTVEVTIPDA
ncbi:hypothetical protein [Chelatococcus sp.]|uniref:hypothetical protein n=1 Tax=Chelatococcus sp. TaxID=1953771 RepID=UPI001ED68B0C|nr:hypothetical protein [Chelatococcus sp.]MBX3547313.1 hypothetical protein [Chelatococcus sp.]CAH1677899.1 conserved hypothetical protein [Hyphomicrobiales bacterium]